MTDGQRPAASGQREAAENVILDLDLSRYEGHTPEPWREENPMSDCTFIVVSDSPSDWRVIAQVPDEEELTFAETTANRALLLDAPKLLAEVRDLREEVETLQGHLESACSDTKGAEEAWRAAETEVKRLREERQVFLKDLEKERDRSFGAQADLILDRDALAAELATLRQDQPALAVLYSDRDALAEALVRLYQHRSLIEALLGESGLSDFAAAEVSLARVGRAQP